MGFLDDLQQFASRNPCKVARWLDTIDDDYRKEIGQAVAEKFPSKTIWRVIVQREGIVFSDNVFARHVKGECSCGIQG